MIAAGIVLFNPDIVRLKENINAIKNQVDLIICIDNFSDNIDEIKEQLNNEKKIFLIENNQNMGIAVALNQTLRFAEENKCKWLLSLDQDSVVMPGIVKKYIEHIEDDTAVITCIIKDRNVDAVKNMIDDVEKIDFCITSGALYNVEKLLLLGGYDEKMFIDYVDFDMCIRLRKAGYSIIRINYVGLLHEVGKTKEINFFGKKELIFNESAFRKYFEVRNRFYYIYKHGDYINKKREYLRTFKFIFMTILYESDKCNKIKRMFKGYIDYRKMIK